MIHPTAIVDWDTVKIGKNVSIGPFCNIRNCEIGNNTTIKSHVSIGEEPEILPSSSNKGVFIGDHCTIREFVTIHGGSIKPTLIENNVNIFRHAHIAHDCLVEDDCLISGGVILCGHVTVQNKAILSAGSIIHQFVVIGEGAFIGAGSFVDRHVEPVARIVGRGSANIGRNDNTLKIIETTKAKEKFYAAIRRNDPTNRSQETKIL